jgi:hypothetical protein
MSRNRIISTLASGGLALGAVAAFAGPASAGVSGPVFYVDHVLYRTVGTPTDLSHTGAPDSTYDTIYSFDDQLSVADSAPGDRGFNGGRWRVHRVEVEDYQAVLDAADHDGNGVLDSVAEVHAALRSEYASDGGIVREFVCTVNKVPASRR